MTINSYNEKEHAPASSNHSTDDAIFSPEETVPAPPKPSPPPNGGTKAWLQVFGSWFMVFNTWGTITTFGDYQAYYEKGTLFHQSSSNIAWIGSIQSLMVFAVGAFIGPIYDRGHLKLLLVVGTFGIVFGHMMLSLCNDYWQVILAQGFVVGIGGGCLFVPALAVIQQYFSTRLGLALGIAATGSSLGGIIYPIIFINLIDTAGFAWTTRAIGFIALGTLMIPITVSQMRMKPPAVRKMIDLSAFSDGPFVVCVLGCFLGYAGSQVAFFYVAFFGQDHGWMSPKLALYLVPILNSASAVGRVLPNWLADRFGAVNVVVPGSLLIGVVLLCNLAVHSSAGVICTSLFFGFLSGIFVATPPLLFMLLTNDKSKLGSRMGLAYAMLGLSVLLGGPGAGGVLQHDKSRNDWNAAWGFAGALPLAAFLVFSALRVWQGGLKLAVKV
ncbi:MFS-type transporter dbaD [Cladobotryum mycophilum]|uniref:MFS-type transporter dbaD n=1 Tax=Cladobotryum mycophilum TaxID=491253 RepID=A0ABR0SZH3_9HYPO